MRFLVILVMGAYGNFGNRLCEALLEMDEVRLIVAGRNMVKAQALAERLNRLQAGKATMLVLKSEQENIESHLQKAGAQLLINASGPYQQQDYRIAQACIASGVHYFDLADARQFVAGIAMLDSSAKAAGVTVVSGASTAPGLSSAVVDSYENEFSVIESYYAGITPGYQAERGDATITGMLSYLGRAVPVYIAGRWHRVTAMQGLHSYDYKNILGKRWLGYMDLPDLELFPKRYPTMRTVEFYSGLEIGLLHAVLWLMTWVTRAGLVKDWARYARSIIRISHCFDHFGTSDGGMFIELTGKDKQGGDKKVIWHLIARAGAGPYIPIIPILVLVKKILKGELLAPGAYPCMGLFTLKEFSEVAAHWKIEQLVKV